MVIIGDSVFINAKVVKISRFLVLFGSVGLQKIS